MKSVVVCLVGVVVSLSRAEPPAQQGGWGQQQQPASSSGGWGQQSQQPAVMVGWGQQQQPAPAAASGWGQMQQTGGWGQQQQQQQGGWGQQVQQSSGWGQQMEQPMMGWGGGQQAGNSNKGGKGGIDWGLNFALGYQGEKGGKGQNKGGHGGSGGGGGGGGWSSEPETNIKKPSIGDIFRSIISLPREAFSLFKESGLWILFVPLIVIIPLLIVAFNAGKFFGGMGGWGWDKRSATSTSPAEGILSLVQDDWNSLVGFIQDPKVQRAAKGFMDEFVAQRVMESIQEEPSPVVKKSKKEEKKQKSS